MDFNTAKKVLEEYKQLLSHVVSRSGPFNATPTLPESIEHAAYMLEQMDQMLADIEMADGFGVDEDWPKFNRWLGFLQGVLWVHGNKTLNEMREDNRG